MLLKSLEFKRQDGIQVKVTEIPVVTEGEHYFFQIHQHLELYLRRSFCFTKCENSVFIPTICQAPYEVERLRGRFQPRDFKT